MSTIQTAIVVLIHPSTLTIFEEHAFSRWVPTSTPRCFSNDLHHKIDEADFPCPIAKDTSMFRHTWWFI